MWSLIVSPHTENTLSLAVLAAEIANNFFLDIYAIVVSLGYKNIVFRKVQCSQSGAVANIFHVDVSCHYYQLKPANPMIQG